MAELSRIINGDIMQTPSHIGRLRYLGECTFRGHYLDDHSIISKNPFVKGGIDTSSTVTEMDQDTFLKQIDDYLLSKPNMYLYNYTYHNQFGPIPKRLHGYLYQLR